MIQTIKRLTEINKMLSKSPYRIPLPSPRLNSPLERENYILPSSPFYEVILVLQLSSRFIVKFYLNWIFRLELRKHQISEGKVYTCKPCQNWEL